MRIHPSTLVMGLFAGLALGSPSPAQNPPAGSFGAGTAGINAIPIGPGAGTGLNNSVNDPSGFGNAAKMPPLPQQVTIPTVPQAAPLARSPQRSRTVVTRVSPRELSSLRGKRAKAVIQDRDNLLRGNLTSICRGC